MAALSWVTKQRRSDKLCNTQRSSSESAGLLAYQVSPDTFECIACQFRTFRVGRNKEVTLSPFPCVVPFEGLLASRSCSVIAFLCSLTPNFRCVPVEAPRKTLLGILTPVQTSTWLFGVPLRRDPVGPPCADFQFAGSAAPRPESFRCDAEMASNRNRKMTHELLVGCRPSST